MSAGVYVPRWLMVSAVTVMVFLAAFALVPPLRTAAQDPLGIFRVKRFTTVTVDPSTLPAVKPDATAFGSLTISQMPQVSTVATLKEAQAMVDFAVRSPKNLPAGMATPAKIGVSKEGRFSYTFDLRKAREYLAGLGIALTDLPAGLDGATVKLTVPAQVVTDYRSADGTGPSLVLSQGHSPVIEAPPGLDVDMVRRQLLTLPGLPPELVAQLQSVEDWKQTAVIPLPKQGVVSKEVAVDGGIKGLYLEGKAGDGHAILWEKGDVVFGVAGGVTPDQLLAAANSLSP